MFHFYLQEPKAFKNCILLKVTFAFGVHNGLSAHLSAPGPIEKIKNPTQPGIKKVHS